MSVSMPLTGKSPTTSTDWQLLVYAAGSVSSYKADSLVWSSAIDLFLVGFSKGSKETNGSHWHQKSWWLLLQSAVCCWLHQQLLMHRQFLDVWLQDHLDNDCWSKEEEVMVISVSKGQNDAGRALWWHWSSWKTKSFSLTPGQCCGLTPTRNSIMQLLAHWDKGENWKMKKTKQKENNSKTHGLS